MSLFRRRQIYDRKRLLAEADQARARGRKRRAVRLYRQVLLAEPNNAELHERIAPLLAETGARFDAWQSFRLASGARLAAKQRREAYALYKAATQLLPRCYEAWRALASLELTLGRRDQARQLLVEGRSHFRGRRHRSEAIALLCAAREIEPWDPECGIDLVRLLRGDGRREEALWLVEQLVERLDGEHLKRALALQWRIEPSLRNTWRWLRSRGGAVQQRATAA